MIAAAGGVIFLLSLEQKSRGKDRGYFFQVQDTKWFIKRDSLTPKIHTRNK